jgi:F-type H+-transporting ATPase subunit epsilon
MARLTLRVVTPERPMYEGEADAVVVPAHDGEIGILPRHAPLLASLGAGELRATTAGTVVRLYVEGGFVQVRGDRVTVLAERAARLEDLDPEAAAAEAAQARRERSPEALRLQQRAAAVRRVASHAGGAVAAAPPRH